MTHKVAIVGSGPSALMCADILAERGFRVTLFEKRGAMGRKLFIAGSSGLNITNALPVSEFASLYKGGSTEFWNKLLGEFGPKNWIEFLETKLNEKTFLGTSGRYFVKSMTAVGIVRAWKKRLVHLGVEFFMNHEWTEIQESTMPFSTLKKDLNDPEFKKNKINLGFHTGYRAEFDAVCLCLGGGSWETESPLRWTQIFKKHDIAFQDFTPTNTGWHVNLPENFFKEAQGLPLKNVIFSSALGTKKGDLVVTAYGLEGTPVYFLGKSGMCFLDLKPDLNEKEILARLNSVKENMAAFRRVKRTLKLSRASEALIYHVSTGLGIQSCSEMAHLIKKIPIELTTPRPLLESISSSGGVSLDEIDDQLMLKKMPGVFLSGEMLDWDAPTGGFLIQGCISMGAKAGQNISHYLRG